MLWRSDDEVGARWSDLFASPVLPETSLRQLRARDYAVVLKTRADKAAAEALAWTVGTALGLKYVAARA